jgi:dihydrofolate reductase
MRGRPGTAYSPMTPFRAIAAMGENRVIGAGRSIPWHVPDDFRWFREATQGGILVMGRVTFESIGRPLPGRSTWVLTRNPGRRLPPEVLSLPHVTALAEALSGESRTAWLCGGATLYRLLLPACQDLYLSRIPGTPEGDAFFPPFEDRFVEDSPVEARVGFQLHHYINPSPTPLADLAQPGKGPA